MKGKKRHKRKMRFHYCLPSNKLKILLKFSVKGVEKLNLESSADISWKKNHTKHFVRCKTATTPQRVKKDVIMKNKFLTLPFLHYSSYIYMLSIIHSVKEATKAVSQARANNISYDKGRQLSKGTWEISVMMTISRTSAHTHARATMQLTFPSTLLTLDT